MQLVIAAITTSPWVSLAGDRLGARRRIGAEHLAQAQARLAQRDPVLRTARTREARLDRAEVELERLGIGRVRGALVVPEALLAGVGLDQLDLLLGAAREAQVAQRLGVDREDRAGRAELRRHVADRRAVGERQRGEPCPEELDEAPDDPGRAQQLGHREHEVGRRRTLAQGAVQAHADDLRQQHRHRLAEHRRLRLDPADPPAEHAEAIDHRRVRVGPDERVGVGERRRPGALLDEDDAREVLQVDLVDDAGVGRHHREPRERLLAPAQERVALGVALELARGVDRERAGAAERVDLDRVVDHKLGRNERVDLRRVAAERRDRVAHRRQIDDHRNAGEVLHQHPRRCERDLPARVGARLPASDRLDVRGGHRAVALGAQKVLEQDLQRERQPRDVEALLQRVDAEDLKAPVGERELGAGIEAVGGHHGSSRISGWWAPGLSRSARRPGPRLPANRLCSWEREHCDERTAPRPLSVAEALGILAAGGAAGAINVVVGSGTLITFPVLLAFGYAPVVANVSNTIGIVPGSGRRRHRLPRASCARPAGPRGREARVRVRVGCGDRRGPAADAAALRVQVDRCARVHRGRAGADRGAARKP